jgi:hypothetical protein
VFTLLVAFHLIGVQPWCMVDKTEHSIQCNYESKSDCLSYNYNNETCIPNPNYKDK